MDLAGAIDYQRNVMRWLPKRDKLDPVQASEYPPAVRPLASIRRGEAELPEAGASAVQVARVVSISPWRRRG